MDEFSLQRILTEAQGYLELGMAVEAWEALETLPLTGCRLCPGVLAVRLLVCARLRMWERGDNYLRFVSPEHPDWLRSAAGAYHIARAAQLCLTGQYAAARNVVGELSALYPEGRDLVTECKTLEAMWP